MAHERRWLTRLSHPTRDVDGAELARARAAEELLREARERREPPEFDSETSARLYELLGRGRRR
jgi:hypothetical protein